MPVIESGTLMAAGTESSVLLLSRAQAGDDAALNEVLQRYLPRMRRWASGRLPLSARGLFDTEDIVQETVIKALRNLGNIELTREGSLQAYLRQALSNRFIDLYRHGLTHPNGELLGSDVPALEPSPLESAIGAEAITRYERALNRLSAVDREAVLLRIEFQHSYDEIAEMLGKTSASSARMTVSRALARLSREMQP